ncbi:hypothetical protein [uncultured Thalassolituus sp.]|uniref:hypothetical protein n=1 Tax=uncultured Thalassolituus sp. TaxID=285273 RepID=UPI002608C35C|nr:hypothetical protein [uncultured Thalassolituus sp.]
MDEKAEEIPEDISKLRQKVLDALDGIEPAGKPRSNHEPTALMLSSTTRASKRLPPYYLVYFLLVDFLQFPRMGAWEKSAWTVPFRYKDRLYAIEHQKMGLRICAPNEDPDARISARPTEQQEADSDLIANKIRKAVDLARPYFDWRAKQEAKGNRLNVANHSKWLFDRYLYFKDIFIEQQAEAENKRAELRQGKDSSDLLSLQRVFNSGLLELTSQSDWIAQAAVDAFFSWTEHAFIHVAILRGRIENGHQVAELASANWKEKFREALDLDDSYFKKHYDKLLILRIQMRNFMAHGAFGKRGEAFSFHSGAGAVPVLLSESETNCYSLDGAPEFDEAEAIKNIDSFLDDFWSSKFSPVKLHLFSNVPSILTFVADSTYSKAMRSDKAMSELIEYIESRMDAATNMDW